MKRNKVLVVDDEMHIRQLIEKALSDEYDIILADNGEDALKAVRNEHPDLVLMDILMPGLDGYTTCYQIKNNPDTRPIPVIMITGIGHELNRKLAIRMGADGYITKPFSIDKLLIAIKQHKSELCVASL